MNEETVYLVSCVKRKQDRSTAAKDLYRSDWFRKARAYVESTGCKWFILSAKYGLVPPDQKIAPYEQTLNKMGIAERRAWASKVLEQIDSVIPTASKLIFLAGERYREFLIPELEEHGIAVAVPMEGLGIGMQLSWLDHHRSSVK